MPGVHKKVDTYASKPRRFALLLTCAGHFRRSAEVTAQRVAFWSRSNYPAYDFTWRNKHRLYRHVATIRIFLPFWLCLTLAPDDCAAEGVAAIRRLPYADCYRVGIYAGESGKTMNEKRRTSGGTERANARSCALTLGEQLMPEVKLLEKYVRQRQKYRKWGFYRKDSDLQQLNRQEVACWNLLLIFCFNFSLLLRDITTGDLVQKIMATFTIIFCGYLIFEINRVRKLRNLFERSAIQSAELLIEAMKEAQSQQAAAPNGANRAVGAP